MQYTSALSLFDAITNFPKLGRPSHAVPTLAALTALLIAPTSATAAEQSKFSYEFNGATREQAITSVRDTLFLTGAYIDQECARSGATMAIRCPNLQKEKVIEYLKGDFDVSLIKLEQAYQRDSEVQDMRTVQRDLLHALENNSLIRFGALPAVPAIAERVGNEVAHIRRISMDTPESAALLTRHPQLAAIVQQLQNRGIPIHSLVPAEGVSREKTIILAPQVHLPGWIQPEVVPALKAALQKYSVQSIFMDSYRATHEDIVRAVSAYPSGWYAEGYAKDDPDATKDRVRLFYQTMHPGYQHIRQFLPLENMSRKTQDNAMASRRLTWDNIFMADTVIDGMHATDGAIVRGVLLGGNHEFYKEGYQQPIPFSSLLAAGGVDVIVLPDTPNFSSDGFMANLTFVIENHVRTTIQRHPNALEQESLTLDNWNIARQQFTEMHRKIGVTPEFCDEVVQIYFNAFRQNHLMNKRKK